MRAELTAALRSLRESDEATVSALSRVRATVGGLGDDSTAEATVAAKMIFGGYASLRGELFISGVFVGAFVRSESSGDDAPDLEALAKGLLALLARALRSGEPSRGCAQPRAHGAAKSSLSRRQRSGRSSAKTRCAACSRSSAWLGTRCPPRRTRRLAPRSATMCARSRLTCWRRSRRPHRSRTWSRRRESSTSSSSASRRFPRVARNTRARSSSLVTT